MARSVWKGPFVDGHLVKKVQIYLKESATRPIKTWSRRSTILPQFVGLTFGVYNGKKHIPVNVSDTLEDAVRAAFSGAAADTTKKTQTILLSPAAASFDQFSSFEARGEAFCALARELICAVSGREAVPHA